MIVVLITPEMCGDGCTKRCAEIAAEAINNDYECGAFNIIAETSNGRSFAGLSKEAQEAIDNVLAGCAHAC